MISIICALLAAAANALSSVLQRKAALSAPLDRRRGLRVVIEVLHHKVWFAGFAFLIVGFVLQAVALSQGALAVVQPILASELPLTLLVAAHLLGGRLGGRELLAVVAMAAGLALALGAAAPSGGQLDVSGAAWATACGVALAAIAVSLLLGWRLQGPASAAFLGIGAGGLFGLTAAFMLTVTGQAQQGPAALFGAWQLYAMAGAGIAALTVLQQAYGAGTLAAAQPGVTIADPIMAVLLGVFLFGEEIRTGWLVPLEVIGVAAIVAGAIELSRCLLVRADAAGR